jgi:sirohydrochlorin ferrochelatase
VPQRTSIAVILSAGGARLDLAALADLPGGRVTRAEFAWGDAAACATATIEHRTSQAELRDALGRWAAGRGWSVTIAPLQGRG